MTSKRIEAYDSLGGVHKDLVEAIFQYIQDEYMDKKGATLPDIVEWEHCGQMPGVPTQTNSDDCGVFTCMFADFLSRNWPLQFTQEHITRDRERLALSIINRRTIEIGR